MTTSKQVFPTDYNLTDPALLAANERGEIAAAQHSAITTQLLALGLSVGPMLLSIPITVFASVLVWSVFGNGNGLLLALFFIVTLVVVGSSLPRMLRFGITFINMCRDLHERAITEAHGEVVWRKKRYQAEVGGRPHDLLNQITSRARNTDLSPGQYRFFLLPHSGLIVSAELLAGSTSEQTDQQAVLSQAFSFSADDLLANTRGEITRSQRTTIRGNTFMLTFFGLVFAAGGIAILLTNPLNAQTVMGVLLFCGIGGFMLYRTYISYSEAGAGKAAVVEGMVQKVVESSKHGPTYYCRIGDKVFSVSQTGYDAVLAERRYRVYYAPRSNTLLSITPLGDGN